MERAFQCEECAYVAGTRHNLSRHVRFNHVGRVCLWPGCPFVAPDEPSLRRHIPAAHNPRDSFERPAPNGGVQTRFNCAWPGCGKNFCDYNSACRCAVEHVHEARVAQAAQANAGAARPAPPPQPARPAQPAQPAQPQAAQPQAARQAPAGRLPVAIVNVPGLGVYLFPPNAPPGPVHNQRPPNGHPGRVDVGNIHHDRLRIVHDRNGYSVQYDRAFVPGGNQGMPQGARPPPDDRMNALHEQLRRLEAILNAILVGGEARAIVVNGFLAELEMRLREVENAVANANGREAELQEANARIQELEEQVRQVREPLDALDIAEDEPQAER
ncbi:hypothetical protein GGR52DRAFT_573763 [Hypoxylon sp. FL1284]|nr:hypothetical protein GGR52DRAFT_573763 [Hypoxylon sp. FL1284]